MKFDYSFVVILLEASRIIAAETILIVERPDYVSRYKVGVDRLSAWPIIAVDIKHFMIIGIGHFQNRCADKII